MKRNAANTSYFVSRGTACTNNIADSASPLISVDAANSPTGVKVEQEESVVDDYDFNYATNLSTDSNIDLTEVDITGSQQPLGFWEKVGY
jgi:hypothetical protein